LIRLYPVPCNNAGDDHRQAGTNAAAFFGDFYGNPGKFKDHPISVIGDGDDLKNAIHGMRSAYLQHTDDRVEEDKRDRDHEYQKQCWQKRLLKSPFPVKGNEASDRPGHKADHAKKQKIVLTQLTVPEDTSRIRNQTGGDYTQADGRRITDFCKNTLAVYHHKKDAGSGNK
jgi:hypothetical protein